MFLLLLLLLPIKKWEPPPRSQIPCHRQIRNWSSLGWKWRRNLSSFTQVAATCASSVPLPTSAFMSLFLLSHSFCFLILLLLFPLASLATCESNCISQFLSRHTLSPWTCFSLPHSPHVSSFQTLREDLMAQFISSYMAGNPENRLLLDTSSCKLWMESCGSKCGSPGLPWWLSGKETRVWSLIWLDPTATEQLSLCTTTTESVLWSPETGITEACMQSTPVLLPGKSHGQRNLVGCSPWGC